MECQLMIKKELKSDKLISQDVQLYFEIDTFLPRLVFSLYILKMLILILTKNKICPWKPLLPQPLALPSLRYSGITMNDTWTPIVKLRQMADLFSKICSAVFPWKRVECVSPFKNKWKSAMELFLISQFSLFANRSLQ